MKMNQKGFGLVEGLVIFIIIVLLGVAGWYVWQARNKENKSVTPTSQTENKSDSAGKTPPELTNNKKTFKDSANEFSFDYPVTWTVKEKRETVGYHAVASPDFAESSEGVVYTRQGAAIFITPQDQSLYTTFEGFKQLVSEGGVGMYVDGKEVVINGHRTYRGTACTHPDSASECVGIEVNGKVHQFVYKYPSDDGGATKSKYQQVFEDLLGSVR